MSYEQLSVRGEDFVGLFGFATDAYAVLAPSFPETRVLKVPTVRTKAYGTEFLGIFCAGNSNGVVASPMLSDSELRELEDGLRELGLGVEVGRVEEGCTAIGNLIAANDKAAILSPLLSKRAAKRVEDLLDVEVHRRRIDGHSETGACCVATNQGFVVHPDAAEELEELSEILGVRGGVASVNFGFPFVRAGLIANSKGFVTGPSTTEVELEKLKEALGLL